MTSSQAPFLLMDKIARSHSDVNRPLRSLCTSRCDAHHALAGGGFSETDPLPNHGLPWI